VFYAPHRWPEHANREPLVLQTEGRLSIPGGSACGYCRESAEGETSPEKRRLLVEEGYISPK
jgi:hypothetical protein